MLPINLRKMRTPIELRGHEVVQVLSIDLTFYFCLDFSATFVNNNILFTLNITDFVEFL